MIYSEKSRKHTKICRWIKINCSKRKRIIIKLLGIVTVFQTSFDLNRDRIALQTSSQTTWFPVIVIIIILVVPRDELIRITEYDTRYGWEGLISNIISLYIIYCILLFIIIMIIFQLKYYHRLPGGYFANGVFNRHTRRRRPYV